MKQLFFLFAMLLSVATFGQETKLHTAQISQSGATDNQILTYDSASGTWRAETAAVSGLQAVETDASLTGDGTTGNELSVDETELGNTFSTDAERTAAIAASDAADGDKDDSNELQNLGISGTSITISSGSNVNIGGTFATDSELSSAISSITYYDKYTEEIFESLNSGNTVTISAAPVNANYQAWTITRGGLKQTVGTSAKDVSISGTTITFNLRNFEDGETVIVQRPNQ